MRSVATTQQSSCPHNTIFSGLWRPNSLLYLIMHGDSIRPMDSVGIPTEISFYLVSDGFPSLSGPTAASPTAAKMYLHAPTRACTQYHQLGGTWAELPGPTIGATWRQYPILPNEHAALRDTDHLSTFWGFPQACILPGVPVRGYAAAAPPENASGKGPLQ